ncbi:FecR family protein [Pedobacter panaciterrae]
MVINKTADGQLVYTVSDSDPQGKNGAQLFNTIETPNGGKYQVNLPDGTRVWLNAASLLRYPTKFSGSKRVVELTGEGYFEVAKLPGKIPFIVKSEGQEVEVLGTHFNINSYEDEGPIKTTLLEGSVRVIRSKSSWNAPDNNVLLRPGEQSELGEQKINVKEVNTESILAWKDGDFVFDGDDLKSIMRKVARWYDVEVIYKGEFDDVKFGGLISRSKNISSVLGIMESTGKIHFVIEGNRITVLRDKK